MIPAFHLAILSMALGVATFLLPLAGVPHAALLQLIAAALAVLFAIVPLRAHGGRKQRLLAETGRNLGVVFYALVGLAFLLWGH